MTTYANARAYWQLFDGVAEDDRVTNLYLRIKIGGTEAPLAGDRYQVSVYGRTHINGENLVTLHQEYIDLPDIGEVGLDESWRYWRTVEVKKNDVDANEVRCVVCKVEALLEDPTYEKQNTDYVPHYADQSTTADPPPWGIRLEKFRINASDLRANVTLSRAITDIVSLRLPNASVHESKLVPRQLAYTELPYSRRQALDDLNAMLDWDYYVWEADAFEMGPTAETTLVVDPTDPRVRISVQSDVHEVYNAVRVCYGNRRGRPAEVVVHAKGSDIPSPVKSQTVNTPDAIRTKSAAIRCGERFLRNHKKATTTGTVTLTGIGPWGDSMLVRPVGYVRLAGLPRPFGGPHKITHVRLNPTSWSTQLEFGVASRRFEMWLRRLEAGAHVRQR